MSDIKTAAVLLIGDELLSGRTRDINLKNIAEFLAPLGIQVREARIVPDIQEKIVEALDLGMKVEIRFRFDGKEVVQKQNSTARLNEVKA